MLRRNKKIKYGLRNVEFRKQLDSIQYSHTEMHTMNKM